MNTLLFMIGCVLLIVSGFGLIELPKSPILVVFFLWMMAFLTWNWYLYANDGTSLKK